MNMIGLGFGPTCVGAASDHFMASHPGHSLRVGFHTLTPLYGLAIVLFLVLTGVLKRESRA